MSFIFSLYINFPCQVYTSRLASICNCIDLVKQPIVCHIQLMKQQYVQLFVFNLLCLPYSVILVKQPVVVIKYWSSNSMFFLQFQIHLAILISQWPQEATLQELETNSSCNTKFIMTKFNRMNTNLTPTTNTKLNSTINRMNTKFNTNKWRTNTKVTLIVVDENYSVFPYTKVKNTNFDETWLISQFLHNNW